MAPWRAAPAVGARNRQSWSTAVDAENTAIAFTHFF